MAQSARLLQRSRRRRRLGDRDELVDGAEAHGDRGRHDPRRRPCARRSEPARRRQEGDVRAARAAAGRPRVALERRAQAALDERRPCRRRRVAADGARRRRLAPRPRHFSCLEPHAHHRALVSRGDGSNRRHQRLSADDRPRARSSRSSIAAPTTRRRTACRRACRRSWRRRIRSSSCARTTATSC